VDYDDDGDGWSETDGDCDDGDDSVHPDAEELPDGVDDDCDGTIDDGTVNHDDDGDGRSEVDGDCDDEDPSIHPQAPEICDDGLDNDCDGQAAACRAVGERLLGDGDLVVTGESTNDELGSAVAGSDVDGDGWPDLLLGASSLNTDGADHTGGAYLVLGPVTADLALDDLSSRLYGESMADYAGSAVLLPGDLDQDGHDDLVVSAPRSGQGGISGNGAVYWWSGVPEGRASLGDADGRIIGAAYNDELGTSVGWADVNGDDVPDLLVGTPNAGAEIEAGEVWLWLGPVSRDARPVDADTTFEAATDRDWLGAAVAGAGDLDGDGKDDVVLGASREDTAGSNAGAAYVLSGARLAPGVVRITQADAVLRGEADGSEAGSHLAALGDLDDDGYDDILVGAPELKVDGADGTGAAYVLRGPLGGSNGLADADLRILGPHNKTQTGASGHAGDFDGDGVLDLVLGGPGVTHDGHGDAGMTWVFYGPLIGGDPIGDVGDAGLALAGRVGGEGAGTSLWAADDLDGDAKDDLVVGATGQSDAGNDAGAAYLVFGQGL